MNVVATKQGYSKPKGVYLSMTKNTGEYLSQSFPLHLDPHETKDN